MSNELHADAEADDILTFQVFGLMDTTHCFRLDDPTVSDCFFSSTGAATQTHIYCVFVPPNIPSPLASVLTYTRQLCIIQVHPGQTILKRKQTCDGH